MMPRLGGSRNGGESSKKPKTHHEQRADREPEARPTPMDGDAVTFLDYPNVSAAGGSDGALSLSVSSVTDGFNAFLEELDERRADADRRPLADFGVGCANDEVGTDGIDTAGGMEERGIVTEPQSVDCTVGCADDCERLSNRTIPPNSQDPSLPFDDIISSLEKFIKNCKDMRLDASSRKAEPRPPCRMPAASKVDLSFLNSVPSVFSSDIPVCKIRPVYNLEALIKAREEAQETADAARVAEEAEAAEAAQVAAAAEAAEAARASRAGRSSRSRGAGRSSARRTQSGGNRSRTRGAGSNSSSRRSTRGRRSTGGGLDDVNATITSVVVSAREFSDNAEAAVAALIRSENDGARVSASVDYVTGGEIDLTAEDSMDINISNIDNIDEEEAAAAAASILNMDMDFSSDWR
ncbi:B113 [miniopterid betaherpesvirus 1]|uniref:B113 n=1 Tax=miniopterid betaherpesvirus 1 TaxID=3070189 RepID=I3VQA3_9BETA|nr:B113 [miniopterid betaherpesvirus 1]AFK83947.1 B113 [miniopterid betaherpesvirus 1]